MRAGKARGGTGKFGRDEVRRSADRGQQVLHQGQVEHLLLGDVHQRSRPTTDRGHHHSGMPSFASRLSENAANRYWQMIRCSSSAALASV